MHFDVGTLYIKKIVAHLLKLVQVGIYTQNRSGMNIYILLKLKII